MVLACVEICFYCVHLYSLRRSSYSIFQCVGHACRVGVSAERRNRAHYIKDSVEPFPALKVLKCTSSCGLSFILPKRSEIGRGVLAGRHPLVVSSGAIFLSVCLCLSLPISFSLSSSVFPRSPLFLSRSRRGCGCTYVFFFPLIFLKFVLGSAILCISSGGL